MGPSRTKRLVFWIDESLNGVEMVTFIPGSDRDSRTCRFNYDKRNV